VARKYHPAEKSIWEHGRYRDTWDGKWQECTVCKEWKHRTDANFWRSPKNNWLTTYCKECRPDPKLRESTYIPKPPRTPVEKKPVRYPIVGATTRVQIEEPELNKVAEYFNWECVYCGKLLREDYRRFVLEHYQPVGRGGESVHTNLVPSCNHCNNSKNWHEPEKWLVKKFGQAKAEEVITKINQFFSIAHTVYSFYQPQKGSAVNTAQPSIK
jgi:hypothetical protein